MIASGSPILAMDGTAIGHQHWQLCKPCLLHHLPGWHLDRGPAEVKHEPDPARADEATRVNRNALPPVKSLRKP